MSFIFNYLLPSYPSLHPSSVNLSTASLSAALEMETEMEHTREENMSVHIQFRRTLIKIDEVRGVVIPAAIR